MKVSENPTQSAEDVTPVAIGDAVRVVDEHYRLRDGLVTAVHGPFRPDTNPGYVPCINVVLVSVDENQRDPYGRQIDRGTTSLQHYSQGPNGMPTAGRYWVNR